MTIPLNTLALKGLSLPINMGPVLLWYGTWVSTVSLKGTIRWVANMGKEIREELMEYDPPYMHFYQIDPEKSTFKFRLKNHIAVVTVESDGEEGSILSWRIYYDYIARPLTALKKPIFNTAIPKGLDGLVKIHGGTRLEP